MTERRFTAGRPRGRGELALTFMRADLEIVVDVFSGEVRTSAHLDVRAKRTRTWRRLVDCEEVIVARFAPSVGQVAGSTAVHPPMIDDARWGRSLPCSPAVLRFFVDDVGRSLAAAGQRAKRALFADHPPFVFNTVACVGCDPGDDVRRYNDPQSPWFNVFFGYYQIDCAKDLWERPFAYRSAAGRESVVLVDDLIRVGMADWIWFSNWMYGLPADIAVSYSSGGARRATVSDQEVHRIGQGTWHRVRLEDVDVATCEEGAGPGARRLADNTPLAAMWRRSFGPPRRRAQRRPSFGPVTLEAVCDLCYWEDDKAFHTVVFGATARAGTDPTFLQTQLAALQAVRENSYPSLGFPSEAAVGEAAHG